MSNPIQTEIETSDKPLTFGKGLSKVMIYRSRNPQHRYYTICFRANGKRMRISRSNRGEAIEYATAMSKFLAEGDKPFVLRKAKNNALEVMQVPASLFHIAGELKAFNLVRIPCIYFLARENVVVYVGKSVNLVKRLGKHLESKLFDSVFYLPVVDEDLDEVEKRFIRTLDPVYNRTASTFGWARNRANQLTLQSPRQSANQS